MTADLCAVEYSPFYGIEKGAVLQEARIFHGPNLDPRRCQQVLLRVPNMSERPPASGKMYWFRSQGCYNLARRNTWKHRLTGVFSFEIFINRD